MVVVLRRGAAFSSCWLTTFVGVGEDGRDNASGITDVVDGKPVVVVEKLAVGGGARTVMGSGGRREIQRAGEDDGAVGEVDEVGPGDVFARVRLACRGELDAVEVFSFAVFGCAITVPDGPPTFVLVGKGGVR